MNLPDHLRRCASPFLICLALLLTGCGPGTGGTGTGPVNGTLSFSGSPVAGALPSGAACQGGCEIALRLEDERVELLDGCRRFLHVGDWSVDADGKASIEGQLEITTAEGMASVPAILQLQFSEKTPASAKVTALVVGSSGGVLSGPAVLQRADGAAPPPASTCRP